MENERARKRPDEHPPHQQDEEPAKADADNAATRNPDPETRRETLELDLMEEGRSDLGEDIGDETA
jgi:hypothetical protein